RHRIPAVARLAEVARRGRRILRPRRGACLRPGAMSVILVSARNKRRSLMHRLRPALLALALSIVPGLAAAQAYPSKTGRIVVRFVAGGATDGVARLLAQKLTETWGQSGV